MVIYGRNPVREALRGRRKVHRIWATEAAAAEGWAPAKVTIVSAEEIEERAESDAHQGVAALVDPYPYADAAELLELPDPLLVALDEITDPQNLGAICRTAEAAGATGVIIPERRAAEVTAAVCKASAGAVEHLPIARVKNLADFLARGQGGRLLGLRRGRRRDHRATTSRTTRAGSSRCSAPRAKGCARGSRRCATTSSRCRCADASNRST